MYSAGSAVTFLDQCAALCHIPRYVTFIGDPSSCFYINECVSNGERGKNRELDLEVTFQYISRLQVHSAMNFYWTKRHSIGAGSWVFWLKLRACPIALICQTPTSELLQMWTSLSRDGTWMHPSVPVSTWINHFFAFLYRCTRSLLMRTHERKSWSPLPGRLLRKPCYRLWAVVPDL